MRFRDQYKQVDPREIMVVPGHNVRDFSLEDNQKSMADLEQLIEKDGIQIALWVREAFGDATGQSYILVDGERRLRITMKQIEAGKPIRTVPVKIVESNDPAVIKAMSLQANTGKALQPWELGQAYHDLEGMGWSREQIAVETGAPGSRVGDKVRYVNEAIELAHAPKSVREALAKGEITTRRALDELRANGTKAEETVKEAVEEAKAKGETQAVAKRTSRITEYDALATELFDFLSPWSGDEGDTVVTQDWINKFFKLAGLLK